MYLDYIYKMTTSYEFERYICSKETLRDTIETFGVAIIPNVLDDIECDTMVNKIWDFLEHITQSWEIPMDRNNIETWNEFYKLYPSHSMLLQHWGIEADKRRITQNLRAVIYLCYMPRIICSKTNLKKKQRAIQELRSTTHYPCNIKLFSKNPHTYGKPIPSTIPVEEPMLNDLGKSLSGF